MVIQIKILTPTNSSKEIEQLIEAGANELYCGVLSRETKTNYTNVGSINRRQFDLSNMKSFREVEESVKIANSYNVPIFLTMNSLYTEEQYPLVIKEIKKAIEVGIDSLIIGDMGLLLKLRELNIKTKIIISTAASVFNSRAIDFYKKIGIYKITMPRQVTINEVKKSVNKSIKLDVFIMNTRCIHEDGFCTFQHGVNEINHPYIGKCLKNIKFDYFISTMLNKLPKNISQKLMQKDILGSTSACHLNYDVSALSTANKKIEKKMSSYFGLKYFPNHCGACALYDFNKMGVNAVKIVGRQNPTKKKVKDVKFLKGLMEYLKKNPDRKYFYRKCKDDFSRVYGYGCGSQCYYPYLQ
jgi:collagenase-like PrtC family protease